MTFVPSVTTTDPVPAALIVRAASRSEASARHVMAGLDIRSLTKVAIPSPFVRPFRAR